MFKKKEPRYLFGFPKSINKTMLSVGDLKQILDFGVPGIILVVVVLLVVIFLISKVVKVSNELIGKALKFLWIGVKYGFTQIVLMIIAIRVSKIIFSEEWFDNQVAKLIAVEQFVNETFWKSFAP